MANILVFAFISLVLSVSAQNVYQSNPLGYPLIQSPSGYLINVNLTGDSLSTPTSETGYMLIATYSPKTILMSTSISSSSQTSDSSCMGFMQYNCSDYSFCLDTMAGQSTTAAPTTYSSPYFTVQLGDPITGLVQVPNVTANSSSSETISTASFTINAVELASSCQTNEFYTFGQGAYGVIGLANRNQTDLFAIYINQTSSNAVLLQSSVDFEYATTDSPVLRLPTSYTNWRVSGAEIIYANQSSISFSSRNVIFDVNSKAIGLSADIFSSFLSMLSSVSIVNCYGDYLPVCTYSGSISSLPDIIIGVGAQNITIPPQVYIKGYGGIDSTTTAITLNFKLVDSSGTGPCYVTDAYSNNTIILDSNFMKYYLTIFNGTGSTIDLYRAANPIVIVAEESTGASLNLTATVVSCLSAVCLLGLGLWYYFYRKRNKPLAPLASLASGPTSEISLTSLSTARSAIFSQQASLEL